MGRPQGGHDQCAGAGRDDDLHAPGRRRTAGEGTGPLRGLAPNGAAEARYRVPVQHPAGRHGPADQRAAWCPGRLPAPGRRRLSRRIDLALCRAGVGDRPRAGARHRCVPGGQQVLRRRHVAAAGIACVADARGLPWGSIWTNICGATSGPAVPTIGFLSRTVPGPRPGEIGRCLPSPEEEGATAGGQAAHLRREAGLRRVFLWSGLRT